MVVGAVGVNQGLGRDGFRIVLVTCRKLQYDFLCSQSFVIIIACLPDWIAFSASCVLLERMKNDIFKERIMALYDDW